MPLKAVVLESHELAVPAELGGGFVRAASGITRVSDAEGLVRFVVVQDDTHELVALDADGQVVAVAALGSADGRAAVPKHRKHDLESVFTVPSTQREGVVALASGSRENRNVCFTWTVSAEQPKPMASASELFSELAALAALHHIELNIEASGFVGEEFWLINRGHQSLSSHVFAWSRNDGKAFAECGRPLCASDARVSRFADVFVDGARLTATDLCEWEGITLVSLSAEVTTNAYDDGAIVGSAIFAQRGELRACGLLVDEAGARVVAKVEGLAVYKTLADGHLEAFCVTDPDDPQCPSRLLRVRISF